MNYVNILNNSQEVNSPYLVYQFLHAIYFPLSSGLLLRSHIQAKE
jgi:hypothetical protein